MREPFVHHTICPLTNGANQEYWSGVSAEAKQLIDQLLTATPEGRLTAQQVLDHPYVCIIQWWRKTFPAVVGSSICTLLCFLCFSWIKNPTRAEHMGSTQAQMKKWRARKRWKMGIHAVIATQRFKKIMRKKVCVCVSQTTTSVCSQPSNFFAWGFPFLFCAAKCSRQSGSCGGQAEVGIKVNDVGTTKVTSRLVVYSIYTIITMSSSSSLKHYV